MEPTEISGEGRPVVFAENQPEYFPLPARVTEDGQVRTRWQFTLDERRAIADGACLELTLHTFGNALQPVHLEIEGIERPIEAPAAVALT